MPLKATVKSSYRKNGKLVVVYTVVGTPKELSEFAQARADGQGISLDDYHAKRILNGGQYTYTVTPNAAMGITADKQANLIITPNGKVVQDDTVKQLSIVDEDAAQIRAARNTHIGHVQAEQQLGLQAKVVSLNTKVEDKKDAEKALPPVDDFVDATNTAAPVDDTTNVETEDLAGATTTA